MYRRPLIEGPEGARHANLSASGSLWKDALILRDDVSNSLWSQLEGWAVRGTEEGTKLESYPFERTTYVAWKQRHPDTLVLFKPPDSRRTGSAYAGYFSDEDRLGIFGSENPDMRLQGKRLVIGVTARGVAVAIPFDELERVGSASFELGEGQGICVWDRTTESVRCFHGAGAAPFAVEDIAGDGASLEIVTREDRRWNLDGDPVVPEDLWPVPELTSLETLASTPVFWFAWAAAYPLTRLERP